MKKILVASTFILATSGIANAATDDSVNMQAAKVETEVQQKESFYDSYEPFMNSVYLGGDLGYKDVRYKSSTLRSGADDTLPVINMYAGYNFTNKYALEIGGFVTTSGSKTVSGTKINTKEKGIYFDLVSRYALFKDFDLLGTLGVQYSTLKLSNGVNDTENEITPRFGLGTEYTFNEELRARAMVRYIRSDYKDALKDSFQYSLGLNYSF